MAKRPFLLTKKGHWYILLARSGTWKKHCLSGKMGISGNPCSYMGQGKPGRPIFSSGSVKRILKKFTTSILVNEVSEFHETCLVESRWAAGFMTTRQPVSLPDSFGIPSISFFLYNQDGNQAIARPILDGKRRDGDTGPSPLGITPICLSTMSFHPSTPVPERLTVTSFTTLRLSVTSSGIIGSRSWNRINGGTRYPALQTPSPGHSWMAVR